MDSYQSVAAVVVTFNREDELKKVIYSLKNQSRLPDEIIVVFQGGSLSTLEWLRSQQGIFIWEQDNKGSAGGFTKGIELAIEKGHEWVWVTDDDAVPALNSLEELTNCPYFDHAKTGMLSSVIFDKDNKVYMSPAAKGANDWYKTVLKDKCVTISYACWPGCLISSKAVVDFGLPIAEYFFYDEDFEFTSRIARNRVSYCVISSHVIHYQLPSANMWDSPRRYKKFVRNRFATIRLSGDGFFKREIKALIWFFKIFSGILFGKFPIGAIAPVFDGLFYRPKVKFPNSANKL